MADWKRIAAGVALPFLGSLPGNLITKNNIPNWYEKLNKPSWRPPNWVFGPVWTTLYASMGYASYLVWRDGGGFDGIAKTPLMLYATQLALNWAWTPIFFGYHKLRWALYEIVVLWGAIAVTGYNFYQINPVAGMLMAPYQAWVTLATALTYCIARDNPENGKKRE